MKSTGAWASLALVALLVTYSQARSTCSCGGYKQPPPSCGGLDLPRAIASGAQVVTYGEPCTCKGSLPYAIQVPKVKPAPIEKHNSYGFSVVVPPLELPPRHLELPVQIQTPIHKKYVHDHLRGKSYGVSVERQETVPTFTYTYDCSVEKPIEVIHKQKIHTPLDCTIEYIPQTVNPLLAPLPIAVQRPVHKPPPEECRLPDLSTTVDRVLLPACPYSGVVPDCSDIVPPKYNNPPPYSHSPCL